jgi:hypothetical protein
MAERATQLASPAPYNVNATQNTGKQQNESKMDKKRVLDAALNDALLDILERVKRVEKDVKELKADMAARSVTISSIPQLPIPPMVPTPPKIQSPPSLAWVPSLPAPAPIPLVKPLPLSPAVPPGLSKPIPFLPPITETTPPTPLKPKPDLGPVVRTIVPVTPEKAHPPHPLSPSITGVVLFSLLLLHHGGSCHWPVVLQLVFSRPFGKRPDPEPPPAVHHSTVLRSELDNFLFASFHYFYFYF